MYLSEIFIENFRIFGSEKDGKHFQLKLNPSMNVLVGENDSGKTAVIDAVCHVLWTTSQDYYRLSEDDFNVKGSDRATNLTIRCVFRDLTKSEAARFLEWLSIEEGTPCLYVHFKADRHELEAGRKGRSINVYVHAGKKGDGKAIEGAIRSFLNVTYLKPLRDAEEELSAGRGSRLSQILQAHPDLLEHAEDDFDKDDPACKPSKLVGIMRQAEHLIQTSKVIQDTKDSLNEKYLKDLSLGREKLEGEISVASQAELRHVLEKLELSLLPVEGVDLKTRRGLGINNVLFMATELLLLGGEDNYTFPFLLIEEPEAHLHPQMQLRLMDFLSKKANGEGVNVQILLTTHSPNLASKADLKTIVVINRGQPYSLRPELTQLDKSDYRFLSRFLDVTKANLFFAKGVMIVEGDAENILLPTLAELLDRSFSKHGVSIVNVGSRGLFRYSRIFQRTDAKKMPINVACLADRDILPDVTDYVNSERRKESQYSPTELAGVEQKLKARDASPVKTFVSPKWTMEYDLAYCNKRIALYLHSQYS